MRKIYLLKFIIPAMLLSAAPLAAQCRMAFNVSIYNDGSISDDLSTVYGYSNYVDNSTVCTCGHGQHHGALVIYAPDGSHVSNNQVGTESSTYMPTAAGPGTYTVVSTASLYSSCAGEVRAGGQAAPVTIKGTVQVSQISMATDPIYISKPTAQL